MSGHYRVNANAALAYLLKGARVSRNAECKTIDIGRGRHIVGKRCGRTQNIGKASQTDRSPAYGALTEEFFSYCARVIESKD